MSLYLAHPAHPAVLRRARPWRPVRCAGTAVLLLGLASAAPAGDLNAEVDAMFAQLGALGNVTAPQAIRTQALTTYAGGSLFLRTPNKVYQLAALELPSASAGCGGIDVFGGAFSHISATEFKNMLRNITAALPGVSFQLALESVSPMLGGLTKWAQGLETGITNARIQSCETAKALVSTAADSVGFSAQETCADLAIDLGLETDRDAARRRCASDRPAILASARASTQAGMRNKAPFVGNLTWKALERAGPALDDGQRALILSLVGTVIFAPEEQGTAPQVVAPTITSIAQLLYGQADAGDGAVTQALLRCTTLPACDAVALDEHYVHTPLTRKVETLMRAIADKIATRTPIAATSPEARFVNQTMEPVYRMLSIGTAIPGSGLADTLIAQYRDVIAADYASALLERYLRLGITALDQDFLLTAAQRTQAALVRERASAVLAQLAQEKAVLYQKVGTFQAVASHLEHLERDLRSSMPPHVLDMLGMQAALARP